MNLPSCFRSVVGLALWSLLLGGCTSTPTPRAYNLKVTLDGALVDTSVQIDLVGANELADLPKWQSYSVTDYWQPNNAFRRDALKSTMQFGRGKPNTQTLLGTDPHWADWLRTGALHLVIVADLPGAVTDQMGNADPRRLILPLDRAAWGRGVETIEILVQESGLRLMTPRKP
jgi:hypothetical protein